MIDGAGQLKGSFEPARSLASTYLSGADVSRTHHVLHLAWHEQVSELFGEGGRPLRDVDVADYEDELPNAIHCHYFLIKFIIKI